MRGVMQENAALSADAYMAWWRLAGVECAITETPVNWLRPAPVAVAALSSDRPAAIPATAKPQDLPAFRAWLENGADHPESRWASRTILPAGPVDAPLMIISDMPDPADIEQGALLSERAGSLFDAMLRAIGLGRADVYITPLFFARPPGGMVEASDLAIAAARMRTHVHLARPRRLLLLGDRTNRALLDADGGAAADSLQDFNHDGGTIPAVATFHPRLLLTQPAAKAQCWRALQSLIEEDRP